MREAKPSTSLFGRIKAKPALPFSSSVKKSGPLPGTSPDGSWREFRAKLAKKLP